MFCFCCPNKKSKEKKNQIDEKLIQVNESSPIRTTYDSRTNRLVMSEADRKIQCFSISQKSITSSNIQTGKHNKNKRMDSVINNGESLLNYDQTIIRTKNHTIISNNITSPLGTQPRFQHASQPISTTKNKSELYQLEHNTEVIYFDTKKEDQFCIRYLINKKPNIERQAKSILNCVLSRKSSSDHPQNYELVLVIPSKLMYQTKHLHIPQNIHAIFTNMRRQQKNPSPSNSTQIVQIIEGDCSFIKTQAFDKIIVILQGQQDPQYIKSFCTQLCKRYSLEEFIKIWWVFPSFMGIEEISDILKQTLRKFLMSEKIQQAAKYLFYEIELIKQLSLEPFVIVKNKRWRQANMKKTTNNNNKLSIPASLSMSSKEPSSSQTSTTTANYQTQICLAMGLLMVEMNQNVMPFYKYFLQNALQQMKLIDYMKYKALLQNQKENFFKKLLFYNLLTEEGCKVLEENNKIIEHKYYNADHRRFTIKHSVKKKFIAAFGFQDSVQTGQNSTPVQQQWDDQLKLQDLKTRKCSWEKQEDENDENDLNLIDEQEIENIVIEELMFESDLREKEEDCVLGNNIEQDIGHSSIEDNNEENNKKITQEEELQIQIVETNQL